MKPNPTWSLLLLLAIAINFTFSIQKHTTTHNKKILRRSPNQTPKRQEKMQKTTKNSKNKRQINKKQVRNVSKMPIQNSKRGHQKLTKQKAEMIKRNHLKRLMELKRQNLRHRRETKDLMRKSTVLGQKMMLAVQNIEKLPAAGRFHEG